MKKFKNSKGWKAALAVIAIILVLVIGIGIGTSFGGKTEMQANNASQNSSSSSSSSSRSNKKEISASSSSKKVESHEDSFYETGLNYEQLARNPKANAGKGVNLTGKAVQVMEEDDQVEIRLALDGDYDQIVYVIIPNSILPEDSRILEDDLLNVKGIAAEMYSYEATSGATITIPEIDAQRIEDQGKAPEDY